MALRKRCRSVGLTRTFTQIASIESPCSWSDGVDERAPGRGDLLLHGLGTGKRAVGLAIPVARVVQVALEGVHDAVQPRRQRGFLGLDDLVCRLLLEKKKLVIRSNSFFTLAYNTTLASRACYHTIYCLFEFVHADFALVAPDCHT